MTKNQKETPQEKPKSTPKINDTIIVAHSTSISRRPKTTCREWWNGAWRAKGSSSIIHIGTLSLPTVIVIVGVAHSSVVLIGALNHISSGLQQRNSGRQRRGNIRRRCLWESRSRSSEAIQGAFVLGGTTSGIVDVTTRIIVGIIAGIISMKWLEVESECLYFPLLAS